MYSNQIRNKDKADILRNPEELMIKKLLVGFLTVLVLAIAVAVGSLFKLAADSREMSPQGGVVDGRLAACPATPNCVSSDAPAGDSHHIDPIADPTGAKWAGLVEKVSALAGATLVTANDRYAHFTFTTKFMRFVDDVEFYHRPERAEIALRSASRVGQGDMNVNRDRAESIRAALQR